MNKVAGVVILYHPDVPATLNNIRSYAEFTGALYVIDNTGNNNAAGVLQKELQNISNRIVYLPNNKNEGIGKPLNSAAAMAIQNGYSWLLTMDQDSWFKNDQLDIYREEFEKLFLHDASVAVVSPRYKSNKAVAGVTYREVTAAITSGSLIQLGIWQKTGGYNESLFIDEVDHEYCYRAKSMGYKVINFENILLEHTIGKEKVSGYFGVFAKRPRVLHSAGRLYFIIRNYLYVRKKYKDIYPEEFKGRDKQVLTTLKNNLLFGGAFFKNLSSIIKGYNDYRNNRYPSGISTDKDHTNLANKNG